MLHALSTNNAADFAHVNRLHRERNRLSEPALAYTALTLANLSRNDHAQEVLDVLLTKSQKDEQRTFWPGAKNHWWLNDEIETSAITALALIELRPQAVQAVIDYLLDRKGVWGFRPAKANGPAVRALAQFYGTGKPAAQDYILKLLVNGKPLQTIKEPGSDWHHHLSRPGRMDQKGQEPGRFPD